MATIYFVSYSWTRKNGSSGDGNLELVRNKPIFTFNDIQDIEKKILTDNGFQSCIIMNYIELDRASNESFVKKLLARRY